MVSFVYLGLININHNNQITIQSQQLVNTIYVTQSDKTSLIALKFLT